MLASSGETAPLDNPKLVAEGWCSQQHPNLLLEQGLDSIFPVPDALAKLCLLDKLLGGGDEEFLWKDQCVLPARKDPGRPTAPPVTQAYHISSDQLFISQGLWHSLCI